MTEAFDGTMIVGSGGEDRKFELHSAGEWLSVGVDWIDLGMKDTEWGPKHKMQIRWLTEDLTVMDDEGKRYHKMLFFHCTPTVGIGKGRESDLRKLLQTWRRGGQKLVDGEIVRLDDEIIGHKAMIYVVHNENNGQMYANANSVQPTELEMSPSLTETARNYVRDRDRPPEHRRGVVGTSDDPTKFRQERPEPEYVGSDPALEDQALADEDDDIPFAVIPFMMPVAGLIASLIYDHYWLIS